MTIELPLRVSVLKDDVLSYYVAKLAQSQPMASRRAELLAGSNDDRYPIRETLFGCCAAAGKQSAKSIAQSARAIIFFFVIIYSR